MWKEGWFGSQGEVKDRVVGSLRGFLGALGVLAVYAELHINRRDSKDAKKTPRKFLGCGFAAPYY
jgi:hypothetical protein